MKLSPAVLALVASLGSGCAMGAAGVVAKPTAPPTPVVVAEVQPAPTPAPEPEPAPAPVTDPDPDWMAACGRG